jgi:hypothetical protein
MTRFLAGLACGAMMVGASWFGNRVGYQQARVDVAAAQRLAAQLRERDTESSSDRSDDSVFARQVEPDEALGDGDCMLLTFPPKPCGGASQQKDSPRSNENRFGSKRVFRGDDRDGPWEDLPTPEISPTDRAKLVAELEARDRSQM